MKWPFNLRDKSKKIWVRQICHTPKSLNLIVNQVQENMGLANMGYQKSLDLAVCQVQGDVSLDKHVRSKEFGLDNLSSLMKHGAHEHAKPKRPRIGN